MNSSNLWNIHGLGTRSISSRSGEIKNSYIRIDRLCGLVVRVPGYIYRGLGSIPGATIFSEKW
jgi:hypothetical protein